MARRSAARSSKPAAETAVHPPAGPTDITDPVLRGEVKRAAVWIGMAALLALVVLLAQPLLVIFGGMVFAALIDGGARLLGRVLPLPRAIRVTIVLVLTAAFLIWVIYFAGSQIAEQAAQLPSILETQWQRVAQWLGAHGIGFEAKNLTGLAKEAMGGVAQLTSAVGGVIGGVTTGLLIVVLGIYFAAEPQLYRRCFAWMLPVAERSHFEGTALAMGKTLRRLLAGRLLGMAVEGVSTWLLLSVYGVPMAGLLGLLTGLLASLPNIGAPLSGALMILVGFSGGTSMGLYCVAVYIGVQTIDGNVIVPMVAKKSADLAPALVLGMQLIMGALFGILGLILADPLLAMLKIALERQSLRNEHHADPAA